MTDTDTESFVRFMSYLSW